MRARRSLFLGLALAVVHASAADAQPAQPWTGIAADEARPIPTAISNGGSEMSPRSMSADGRFVVFHSNSSNLVVADGNSWTDVFLRDRQTGELRRVSVASDGSEGNHYSAFASISSNGRHIAFNSCATNFDPADTNNSCDLFIHDRELGATVRASLGPNGEQATITTQHHFNLSADGRYFVFNAGFGGHQRRVYLRDRDTDENGVFDEPGAAITTLVSLPDVGSAGFEDEEVAISHDGRWIAYNALTWAVDGAPLGTRLYLYDRVATTTVRVDRAMAGGPDISAYSGGPDFSESGHLAYWSNADNLAEGDTDGDDDVYVYDIATGVNTPIELSHPGAPALDAEWSPAISADGRFVAFSGVQYGQGWNTFYNVYAVDRQTGLSSEISVWPDGTRDDGAGAPSISADGAAIAFAAGAEMLLNGWGNDGVFVATGVALSPSVIEVPADGGTFTIDVTVPAGVAWTLNTIGAEGAEFSQTSGVGPATVDVTLWENYSGQEQDLSVVLGTEQVILHQTVNPQVWWVYPYEGGVAGGTPIEIYGQSFVEGATVTIDGIPATDVVVVDSQNITATTPAHPAPGWASITVTNPSGASKTLEYAFFYRDLTPPVVTYEIAGTLGSNGWYTSDVWVNWNYEDPESTVFLNGCENPFRLLTDAAIWTRCSVTSEGGPTTVEIEVKRDTVPPAVALWIPPPQAYILGEVVAIAQSCTDDTSGIATCTLNQPGPHLDTSAVGTFELSLTGVDFAGHSTTESTSYTVKKATAITMPMPTNAVYGGPALLRATLLASGAPFPGRTITFSINNVGVGTAITSATGEAALNLPLVGRNAGSYELRAEFAGDDGAVPALFVTLLVVSKATPVVTWANPAFIAHGTPLSGTQLNATSPIPGTFEYNPPPGAVLAPGTHTLTAHLLPLDEANYNMGVKTVTLKVKALPVITWATPAPVTYPAFSSPHLNATANVPGTFVYTPPWSTLLNAGTHTLSVTFTPANINDYATTSASVTLEVRKGTPAITWTNLDPIYYKTPLGAGQLKATSPSASGTFAYTPPAGTILPAGTHTLSVTFTPSPFESNNWEQATATKSLVVGQYPASVNWNTPAAITWGTPLGPAQQNATVYPPELVGAGVWTYSPPPGTVMEVGQHWITVSFNPDDPNYSNGSYYVLLTVQKAPTTITWSNPAPIVYPASILHAQLNATASVPGTFNYSPVLGTQLPAGTHTLNVIFNPTDSAHYQAASKNVTIVVQKGTPVITWNNPAPITYGTALGWTQLSATVNVGGGFFQFNPGHGTILNAGEGQTLSVTYFPSNTNNYNIVSKSVLIDVVKRSPIVSWPIPAPITYGTPLGAAQHNATADVPGSFAYTPAAGALLPAGSHTLSMTFTPTDAGNFSSVTLNRQFLVVKANAVLAWQTPAPITYGTPLSPVQLNATANTPGTFSYPIPVGTVLPAGTHTLYADFMANDLANYMPGGQKTVVITVLPAVPVLTWAPPAPIVYGTALSATQLNATASVPGTFSYSQAAGSVLAAGSHSITATFTPQSGNYTTATATVEIVVGQATPVVSWSAPASITYGTALGGAQLNATANVAGTFAYSPPAGTVLTAGNQALVVVFTPEDAANYVIAKDSTSIVVAKGAPAITWANPAGITYGTALSAAQLNASASVAGSFAYSPTAGTVLGAGTQNLSATFTPDDSTNYDGATAGVSIEVAKAVPVVTWTNPAGITYGTALSAAQLNATANVPGSFAYAPAAGTVPGAGTHNLSAVFTPADAANYTVANADVSIVVAAATPILTWANPAGITYGAALSATQLNATANVPGTFAYSPGAGTVLNAGTQPLSVTFTPNDSANYSAASTVVSIVVAKAVPIVSWSNPAGINYGTALSATQLNATANVPGSFAYSPAAGTVLGAGTHALSVTFTPADAANYTSPSSAASITIAKVPLTVRTTNTSKVYGQAMPVFTWTGTGFVNGDTVASLGGIPSFATSATATSAPGTYSVAPSGATSPNYTITFAAGTLTITKAATSVAFTTTPNPSANNQNVQLRAVISPVAPGAGTPTGTVTFRRNGTVLGTATLVNGVATLTKKFSRGTHSLTASYAGNTNFTSSSGAVTHQVP